MSDTPTTPAGWYDDGSGRRRYWDGAAWTDHYETQATGSQASTEASGASTTDSSGTAPTEAYGASPADPYGTTPTQAYGASSTDPYGTAPTQAYGGSTPDAAASAPTQAYGSDPAYGATPAYAPPAGYGDPGSAAPSGYPAPTGYGAPAPYGGPGQYGPPAGYGRAPSSADGKPSVLGLVALGLGALALILAFVPAVGVASFGLAPIAIILAIVAFFLRGKKWPAIAGVIVGVVALIAAVVMFFVYIFLAAGQVISDLPDLPDGTSTVAPPSEDGSATPDDADTDTDTDSGDGAVGSIDNPAPLGSTITGSEYTVVINSVELGADATVEAGGNPPAEDGLSYALINATVTYTGDDGSGSGLFIFIDYVAPDGTTYSFTDNDALAPDPQIDYAELPAGEAVTGNTVLAIPVDADGVLSVTPGLLDDPIYVSLR